MASSTRQVTDRSNRYRSLRNFYLADARRRSSREEDVGLWWRVGAHGPLYRAAWVRGTGELYVTRLGLEYGKGEVTVLGRTRDRGELERALHGWRDACYQPDSMTWLRHRAARLGRPGSPTSPLARGGAHRVRPTSGDVPAMRPPGRRPGPPPAVQSFRYPR
jgi:hypothetical protein